MKQNEASVDSRPPCYRGIIIEDKTSFSLYAFASVLLGIDAVVLFLKIIDKIYDQMNLWLGISAFGLLLLSITCRNLKQKQMPIWINIPLLLLAILYLTFCGIAIYDALTGVNIKGIAVTLVFAIIVPMLGLPSLILTWGLSSELLNHNKTKPQTNE